MSITMDDVCYNVYGWDGNVYFLTYFEVITETFSMGDFHE